MDHKYLSYTGLKRFFYTKILKLINLKIDKINGDISNTKVRSVETIDTKFPIPAAGETIKRFLGKVMAFLTNIKPLETNVTYYVSTASGNDTTGDGSQAKPFSSITKALSVIPKNLGGYVATIKIDDGSYGTTGFTFQKYYNGTFRVVGNEASPEKVIVPFSIIDNYAKFIVSGINFKAEGTNSGIWVGDTFSAAIYKCIIDGNQTGSGVVWRTSLLQITDTVFNNCLYCISSWNTTDEYTSNAIARMGSCTGTGNTRLARIEKGILQLIDDVMPEYTTEPTARCGSAIIKSSGAVFGTLQSSVAYYVATTGSDTNAGTSTSPFKTIKHALSIIPKDLGGQTATIHIDDGTYDEAITVNGYYGGMVVIKSMNSPEALNTLCRIKKVTVLNCDARIQLHGLYFTQIDDVALSVTSCNMVFVRCCQAIESAISSYAFDFTYAKARLSSCKSLNHRSCIRAYVSDIRSEYWTESSATEWGVSISGGKLSKVGNQPSGTYGPESIQEGGIFVSKYGGTIGTLSSDIAIYVSNTGSDASSSGSSTSPYRTIKYAISTIPRDLGGFTAVIYLADGIYDESVVVNGYHSGTMEIRSQSSSEALNTVCKVKKMTISNCMARVQLYGIYFTQTIDAALTILSCHMLYIRCCQAIESAPSSPAFNFSYTKVRMSGCRSIDHINCVRAFHSEVSSQDWVSSLAVEYGLWSDTGGKISKAGIQPGGLKGAELASNGGILVSKYSAPIGALQYDVQLYVSPTGSDTYNTGSSESSPFKTITYALSTIPKDLAGFAVTIYLADGTYDETVNIRGYSNGQIDIRSKSSATALNTVCRVKKITVFYCSAKINLFGLYMTQTDDIAIDIANNNSLVYIMGCQAIESAPTSYGFNITYSKARIEGCKVLNHRICAKALFSNMASRDWVDSSGVEYGIVSDMGATISKIGAQPSGRISPEHTSNGGTIVEANGTQITNITNSGLSCTWGTISGGIVRNGITGGDGMITVQLRIQTNTTLTAGNDYVVTGFPLPPISIGASCSFASTTLTCHITPDGILHWQILQNISQNAILLFNCTYKTNS